MTKIIIFHQGRWKKGNYIWYSYKYVLKEVNHLLAIGVSSSSCIVSFINN